MAFGDSQPTSEANSANFHSGGPYSWIAAGYL